MEIPPQPPSSFDPPLYLPRSRSEYPGFFLRLEEIARARGESFDAEAAFRRNAQLEARLSRRFWRLYRRVYVLNTLCFLLALGTILILPGDQPPGFRWNGWLLARLAASVFLSASVSAYLLIELFSLLWPDTGDDDGGGGRKHGRAGKPPTGGQGKPTAVPLKTR